MKSLVLILVLLSGIASKASSSSLEGESSADVQAVQIQPDYPSFHAGCMAREMTMWGDVAELMMELSTAHCYCKYIGLEKRGSFSEDNQQTVASSCYREATMDKKAGFIWWALPLHLERMKQ